MKRFHQPLWINRLVLLLLLATTSLAAGSQVVFNDWFENKGLRIDYYLAGNSSSQSIFLDELKAEPFWSGSFSNTIDKLNFGTHQVEVSDKQTGTIIYSFGFCTLFQEWQTVNEAKQVSKAFEQVTRIPFPKKPVIIKFKHRNKNGKFEDLYQLDIDPSSIYINKTEGVKYPTSQIVNNGNPNEKLDIVFIAEGYTASQMEKFRADVTKLSKYLFSNSPFDKLQSDINIWAVESPSANEGPTNPGKAIWNTTPAGTSFYTFGIDRYLTTTKFKRVMDVAANAPGDIVYILVNTKAYGGGGIYNHYNVATSDHRLTNEVFIHELGHGLAGLGDEYYTSDVAYEEFYPLNVEPWEPNLTTLVNFGSKWADLLDKSTIIPTPSTDANKNLVGVYEGGGYSAKGVYRPQIDCRMKSNEAKGFCPVCQRAISRVVKTYSK
jgi:hypothetical protein